MLEGTPAQTIAVRTGNQSCLVPCNACSDLLLEKVLQPAICDKRPAACRADLSIGKHFQEVYLRPADHTHCKGQARGVEHEAQNACAVVAC